MLQRKTIQIQGRTVSYADEGKGSAMVFLHGFCGSADYWEEVVPFIAKKYRIIVPDLRGHGQSSPGEEGYSIEDLADDLHQLLQMLGVKKPMMLGHSLGGYITLAYAEAYSEHLTAFGLVHSTAFPDSKEAKQNRLNSISSIEKDGIHPFVDQLIPKLFSPNHLQTIPEKVEHAKRIGYSTSPKAACHMLEAMRARKDRNAVIINSSLPVLLAAGTEDQVVSIDKTHSVDSPHVVLATLKDCGHMSMFENPDLLSSIIIDFAKKCSGY